MHFIRDFAARCRRRVQVRSKLQIASRSRRRKKWMERWKVVRATPDASACLTAVYTRNRYAPRFHALACAAASAQLSFYSTASREPTPPAKRQPCTPCISILLALPLPLSSVLFLSLLLFYLYLFPLHRHWHHATTCDAQVDSIPAFDDGRERVQAD